MTQDTAPEKLINAGLPADSIFFSPATRSFYLGRHYDRFGDKWPSDAKRVTLEVFSQFAGTPPEGQMRGCDAKGNPMWVPIPAPTLTAEQAAKVLNSAADSALDAVAKAWGYTKGIDNATTWATSTNPQFAAEGKALATWRDAVWAWVAAQPAGTTALDGMPAAPDRPTNNSGAAQ